MLDLRWKMALSCVTVFLISNFGPNLIWKLEVVLAFVQNFTFLMSRPLACCMLKLLTKVLRDSEIK